MIFVVGGNGLVGSAVVNYLKKRKIKYKIIQKENKKNFFGKTCDILIYANGNASKGKANADPLYDFIASVDSTVEYIHRIKSKMFILISTVDVYENTSSILKTREDNDMFSLRLHPYGFHKKIAEEYVKRFANNYLIFRIGGIVGDGLKKNPVYDFINSKKKVRISKKSKLNFIHTNTIADVIFTIMNKGIINETFNLASKNSIEIGKIENLIKKSSKYTKDSEKYLQNYQINIKKISKLVDLSTSEDAILEYYNALKT
jgi:nucleoside-diphosphate-sugar epimerase